MGFGGAKQQVPSPWGEKQFKLQFLKLKSATCGSRSRPPPATTVEFRAQTLCDCTSHP